MNKENGPVISLCIPTNGISRWVFPVLDSIYSQNVDESLFEVAVSDNGDNKEFEDKMIRYRDNHSNLKYKKSDSFLFHNQLDVLKIASGTYLKLVNHRGAFTDGSLQKMIDIVRENSVKKPVMYFSNGTLDDVKYTELSFDHFVKRLSWRISWTTGVGIWKEDYDRIPENAHVDEISPHSCILFSERNKPEYLIYNWEYSREVDTNCKDKGHYDIFKAFAVEEPNIALRLYLDGDITSDTFKTVREGYKELLKEFYWRFVVRKDPCSYDLSGFQDAMGIYYSKWEIIAASYMTAPRRMVKKIRKCL